MDERKAIGYLMNDKKLESRQFFDKVAPGYDQHRYAGQASWIHKRILAEAPPFERALDIGCGTGTLLGLLKQPNVKLAGADLSDKMIAEAKSKLSDGVDLRVADAENLPWEKGSFDLVVCALSFHHYPNPTTALAEMRRVQRAQIQSRLAFFLKPQIQNALDPLTRLRSYSQRLATGFVQTFRAVTSCQAQDTQAATKRLRRIGGRLQDLGDDLGGLGLLDTQQVELRLCCQGCLSASFIASSISHCFLRGSTLGSVRYAS